MVESLQLIKEPFVSTVEVNVEQTCKSTFSDFLSCKLDVFGLETLQFNEKVT